LVFRGGGFEPPKPPHSVRHCLEWILLDEERGSIGLNEKIVKKEQLIEYKITGKSIRKMMKTYRQKTEWKSLRKLEK
jgi:hypothetical protein